MITDDALLANGQDPESPEDGQLVEILDAYLAEVEVGREVDVEGLIAAHPAIADRLRDFIGVLQAVGQVTDPDALRDDEAAKGWTPLGDYRILRQVGRGGMGIVYEAEQVSLGRRVALKVLPFASALDPPQLARFKLEAQAAAQLHHANIVPIHAIGSERGVHFYAMQFIDGRTLDDLIGDLRRSEAAGGSSKSKPAQTPRPDSTTLDSAQATPSPSTIPSVRGRAYLVAVAELGIQAAEALDHAHRLGIVHRDVKPANLMIDDRGHLWVTDFGLARVQSNPGLTSTGNVLGTLRYMSPEQALSRRDIVDHRADIYSLGATLYELLTLRPVFEGGDRAELLLQIERDEPRPPRRLDPSIPVELETIVLKALAKEPSHRYATAKDLADDLRRHLDNRPIQARRPTPWQRVAKWTRRHQALTASAGAILLISVVVLSIALALIAAKQRELVRERAEAIRQGERALKNYRMARDAVGEMLRYVGSNTLRNIPRTEHVRLALLEKALAFYERLAAEEDPAVALHIANTYRMIADVDRTLGRNGEAGKAIDRSIEILERLNPGQRSDPASRLEMAIAQQFLAKIRKDAGDIQGSEEAFRRSVASYEDLMAVAGDVRHHRDHYAGSLTEQMLHFMENGRLDDAEKKGRRALELIRGLLSEFPEDSAYLQLGRGHMHAAGGHHSLAGAILNDLASIAQRRRDWIGSWSLLSQAIGHQNAALARDPSEPVYRAFLANHLMNLAHTQVELKDPEAAIEATLQQDIAIREGLMGDFPHVPEHRHLLANSLNNLAVLMSMLERWDEVEQARQRAVEVLETLVAEHPDAEDYAKQLATAHMRLGVILHDRGRVSDEIREFRRAIELYECLKVAQPEQVTTCCVVLSLALGTAADPKDRDPARAITYARKALNLDPVNENARANLGMAHYASGRWDEAIEFLESVAKGSRDVSLELFYLAMARHRRGDAAEARQWFILGAERMDRRAKPGKLAVRTRAEAATLLGIDDRPAVGPASGAPVQAPPDRPARPD